MFDRDVTFPLDRWPCPTTDEDGSACKKQKWTDGDARRSPTDRRREHLKGGRTFACAFYDRLARGSPCEGARQSVAIWLLDEDGKRMPNARYRLKMGPQVRRGTSDADGLLLEQNVLVGASAQLEWGTPSASNDSGKDDLASGTFFPLDDYVPDRNKREFRYESELYLNADDECDEDERADRRLSNLGYASPVRQSNVNRFVEDYGGDGALHDTIARVHDEGTPRDAKR
jgi:hypothetical protein